MQNTLEKLQAQPSSSCGPVEVALPGLVFDLSSLVLYGAEAVPVRLKILLDRLYSILTPEQVGHILHTLGWSLGDYVRGYMLQYPGGKVLDRWMMVTPEEELLILKQFLRFGETRPIVELMTLQCLAAVSYLSDPELKPASKSCQSNISTFIEHNGGTSGTDRKSMGDSCLVAGVCRFEKGSLADHNDTVHHFENFPSGLSLLLPFHFPSSAFQCLVSPTKDPPLKLTQCLQKPNGTKLAERHRQDRGKRTQENPIQSKGELALKIKADPDKPNPARSLWRLNPCIHGGRKGRVCCGVCGKSFYDKGTLKIHYNAVHLKIKHRCTVVGCTMVFSSLRSRNRHSANPNPRLHTSGSRDAHTHRNTHSETHKREQETSNILQQQDDDAYKLAHIHTLRKGLNSHTNPHHGSPHSPSPQVDSPPPSPHPLVLNTKQNDSAYRSDLHPQVPPHPPPPLHLAHRTVGSPPSLIPLVVPAAGQTEHCRPLLSLNNNHTAPAPLPDHCPVTMASRNSQYGCNEGRRGELTNQQRQWESGDHLPKKKPRKSSMPVKIERELEGRSDEDEC
ncbi:zinc finger protein basonuclin-2 [Seriola aureovittata]|uniref:zinc finger protein basonuclin-2 n=1 Tax=Seriola aureovittata TaxID=2871759 RepID=UPI0024BDB897|nr:zinc finger protein basonuclin-2 [Seriola aureovittata]